MEQRVQKRSLLFFVKNRYDPAGQPFSHALADRVKML